MDFSKILTQFFQLAQYDPRITTKHISIFSALVQQAAMMQSFTVHLYSHELMEISKVSCKKNYCRALTDLSRSRYLHYEPSFNRKRRSSITLRQADNVDDDLT